MDLAGLRTAVTARAQVATGDAVLGDATVLTSFVNAANNKFSSERDWPWLEAIASITTADGTETYALPSEYLRTQQMEYDTDNVLSEARSISEVLARDDESGIPQVYAIHGNLVYLAPVPDAVYTIRHFHISSPTILAADGDTPEAPAMFHEAIAEYATFLLLRREGAMAEAGGALAAYQEWVRTAGRWVDRGGSARVRVRPGNALDQVS